MDKFSRGCGVILPLFSLPSPYGVGNMGKCAFEFIDFLESAGQSCWQLLPLNPPGRGDSPYHPLSVFAGWEGYIDLGGLRRLGLLEKADILGAMRAENPRFVDYAEVRRSRDSLLRLAFSRRGAKDRAEARFYSENADWLPDYARFMAQRSGNEEDCEYYAFLQYLFFSQWERLMEYARSKGVSIIGDLPIYCSPDGAELASSPGIFQTDGEGKPAALAGVPPDYFARDGQLWGNPLYDWNAIRDGGWEFWLRRLQMSMLMYDIVRLDHFRGFESYYSVQATAKTAREGHFEAGPGYEFLSAVTERLPGLRAIAEDLGDLTEGAKQLRRDFGFPGMRVLQFAFGEPYSEHIPESCGEDTVYYTGTHDNDTLPGWQKSMTQEERERLRQYLGDVQEPAEELIRRAMRSEAVLFMAQMQDYLGFGSERRTNIPGTEGAFNWSWRLLPGELSGELAKKMRALAEECGRTTDSMHFAGR